MGYLTHCRLGLSHHCIGVISPLQVRVMVWVISPLQARVTTGIGYLTTAG